LVLELQIKSSAQQLDRVCDTRSSLVLSPSFWLLLGLGMG
jgi:hypothetical protein